MIATTEAKIWAEKQSIEDVSYLPESHQRYFNVMSLVLFDFPRALNIDIMHYAFWFLICQ